MRRDNEDELDRQQMAIEACRSQLNAAEAHLWLHRGAVIGGVIARLRRRLAKRRAAGGGPHAAGPLGGGRRMAGGPDG